jgi:hypothetical protein
MDGGNFRFVNFDFDLQLFKTPDSAVINYVLRLIPGNFLMKIFPPMKLKKPSGPDAKNISDTSLKVGCDKLVCLALTNKKSYVLSLFLMFMAGFKPSDYE